MKNFIVFEGIDGSGTSTQIELLQNALSNASIQTASSEKIFFTAEPTTLETGLFLRTILAGKIETASDTRAFLFAADRAEHVYGKSGIIEQLNSGKTVVCDSYLFSSLAYQGIECGFELPQKLNAGFPLPEYLFFFDIEAKTALERIAKRGGKTEIYEKLDYLEKTVDAYRRVIAQYEKDAAAGKNSMKIIRIDANLSAQTINQTLIMPIIKM